MTAIDWRSTHARFLGIAFVGSGVVALGCETVWFRALALLFGSTITAAGMLLAVFMSGLAIGAEIAARVADRSRHPARLYALAECVVAVSALVSPRVFALAQQAALAHSFGIRALVCATILAPPTIAMGTTLPLLSSALVERRAALQSGLAALYALNLVGASAGAFVATYLLLPRWGLSGSTRVLALMAFAVAALALAASRAIERTPATTSGATSGEPLAVFLAAMIGVLTFALQVTWNRVFALLLGSSAFTFGLVASAILAANALGSLTTMRSREQSMSVIARRILLFAITTYLGTLVVFVAPFPLAAIATRGESVRWVRFALVAGVVGVPSFLGGALFPALASRFPAREIGRAAGRAQLVVTAGNVLGALAASLVGVPRFGAQTVLFAIAASALVLACIAAIPAGLESVRGIALAAVLAAGFAYFVHPSWDRAALSAGTFRVAAYRHEHESTDAPCGASRRFGRHRVLFAREGSLATVVVLGHPSDAHCSLYSLRINGKAEGSVFVDAPLADRVPTDARVFAVGDLPTEVLAGWLPGALAQRRANALLVGWGTGISTRALLATNPAHVTSVEIEPSVLDAADLFEPSARRDARVEHVIDDARTVIARWPLHTLDVIASHPSNPWVTGAGALFSIQYFRAARDRLREGGRMLAWIQLYDSDREVVRGQLATFAAAFPETFVIRPERDSRDLLLLGIVPPGPRDRDALRAQIATLTDVEALRELTRAGIDPATLDDRIVAEPGEVARITRGARVHDEDDAWVEFRVAEHLLRGDGESVESIVAALF